MKYLLLGLILFSGCILTASNKDEKRNRGFYSTIEAGYFKDLTSKSNYPPIGNLSLDHVNSLRLSAGYFINPYITTGLGFGAERYVGTETNTFPLFFDLRAYLKDSKNTPFAFFDTGGSITFSRAQEKGPLLDAGIGYKYFVGKKTCLTFKIGYHYFKIKEWWWGSENYESINPPSNTYQWYYLKMESLSFQVGLFF
jgi:hypothetical protein